MGRRRRWYWTQNGHIKPNGTVNGETSAADFVNGVCVNGASPVAASEPVAVQGVNHGYEYESPTRMGEKPVTPPSSTAAVVNGNGASPLSSEGDSTGSDMAALSNCSTSSDPGTPMTAKCEPVGPKKRSRNKYRIKKKNEVLENPDVHVAPQLPPQEKEDLSFQEVKSLFYSQTYGKGTSSHSSEPDSTDSNTAAPAPWSFGSNTAAPAPWSSYGWRSPRRCKWRDRLNRFNGWRKKNKVSGSEPEYPAFPVLMTPRPEEEEDWSEEIEEFTRTVYASTYGPEDVLTSELRGLRVYENTSPLPGGLDNYVPSSHHRRPVRWTCSTPAAELDQFADADNE